MIILTICAVISTLCLILIAVNIELMLSAISKQLFLINELSDGSNKVLQDIRDLKRYESKKD